MTDPFWDRVGDGTMAVHAGNPAPRAGAPLLPGPVLAAPYHLTGGEDGDSGFTYGRNDNPTWRHLETAIGALDGGTATVFSSGMAAVAAVLLGLTRAGDTVVLPADGYYTVRELAGEDLARHGITVREVPTTGPYGDALGGARLVLLETPSNPGLDVCDLAELSAAAHRAGALVAVDNTTATPLGQRPLDLGADLVVASDTKALTGHSDLLLGHVSTRDETLVAVVRGWRVRTGAVPGPVEAWLAHRSLGTLDLRLARHAANAAALADVLVAHAGVRGVRWPGRPDDPAYPVASRQMRRMGGVLSATLPDAAAVDRFLAASRLVTAATSFGGLHTTLDRRAQWGVDAVPPGFVRISAGCEDTADLVADFGAALGSALG
jgi:cystathionine gamma-lyase